MVCRRRGPHLVKVGVRPMVQCILCVPGLLIVDPLEQLVTLQIRVELQREGKQVAEEEYTLTERVYFKNELLTMLEQAGYSDIAVQADYTEAEATAEHSVLVFLARK